MSKSFRATERFDRDDQDDYQAERRRQADRQFRARRNKQGMILAELTQRVIEEILPARRAGRF